MKRVRVTPIILAIAGYFLVITAASAQSDSPPTAQTGARALVEQLHEALISVMKAGPSLAFEGRMEALQPVVGETFDLRVLSAKTVGVRIWEELSDEQRSTYVDTFSDFLVASYADKFDDYSGQSFEVVSTEDAPKGLIYVKAQLNRPDNTPILLNYLIGARNQRPGIIDVFFDNVSEAARRQSEFKSIYYNSGFEALLDMLSNKIDQMAGGGKLDQTPPALQGPAKTAPDTAEAATAGSTN